MKIRSVLTILLFGGIIATAFSDNIAEEIAWVVGDEPIYKSEIEEQYMQMQYEKVPIDGDPYCVIPERMAIEKLFLHQAKLDSIDIPETSVIQEAEARINWFASNLGSKEKVEEYFRKPLPEVREQLMDMIRNQYLISEVQKNLTKNVKATPSDVRKYYSGLEESAVPFIPLQVEVQIITINPAIPQSEIDEIKSRLRDYADRVNKGESEFSTLAILYSEDGAAMNGGELGFKGKAELVPEFANVAFNLNDPKKASKVVETEYGYHIIQLIEKRGDRVNVRHIILRPKVQEKDLTEAINRLDSLRNDILDKKFTFDEVTMWISQDKDTRNNKGIMVNAKNGDSSTRFQMSDLPQEVSKAVENMNVGEISKPFIMMDSKLNKEVVAIVKLTNRIEGHKATLSDDYQTLKHMYESEQSAKIVQDWIKKKKGETYVKIEDGWKNCDFEYEGWGKK